MMKILIVEDDTSIQALLHDFIKEAGYDVAIAADGVEALTLFSEQAFDLILLDIIPDEDIPKLFEAFYSVEQSRNRQTGGSGLGLYVGKIRIPLQKPAPLLSIEKPA